MWQWLHATASACAVSIHAAGYFQKITFGEGQRRSLPQCFHNVSQVLGIDMRSVMSLLQLLFFYHKVTKTCVCFPTLTKKKIDSHRYMGGKNVSVYKEKTLETQGPEFSLRGRRCEQIREKGMLPNLSAADVACWAELSFSWILGRSGTVDPRRAEKCGREAWQETERRDLFREPLCVMTEWQDSEVCVRWLHIQVI